MDILSFLTGNRYVKHCYLLLKQYDENGYINWALTVRLLLFSNGFGFAWLCQEVGNSEIFLYNLKQRLLDMSRQTWSENINVSTLLSTYYTSSPSLIPKDI